MKRLRRNLLRTIPVMTGYLVLGMGFGILMQSKGFGFFWSLGMSVAVFAGSMQYVAVDLLAAGASLISAAIATLMVNARHLFYGISMVDRYKNVGAGRWYLIFGLTDETYAIVSSDETLTKTDLLQITLLNQIYWVTGSVLGSLAGALIPWDFKGMDFALTALFVSILVDQWRKTRDHLPALFGIGISLACLLLFGADSFLIPSMLGVAAALTVLKLARKEAA